MGRILAAGAINTDLVARVNEAPNAGETVTGHDFAIYGGGKGANQAVAAARSGAVVTMLGAVGADDFGRQRLADLTAEGIDVRSVATLSGHASGVALIVVEDATGQNRIAYVPGATMALTAAQTVAATERARPAVILATLEPPEESVEALVEAGRAGGALVVLNATPEAARVRPLLSRIDVLIVNEPEAAELLGHPVTAATAAEAAVELTRIGAAAVVLTLGAAGAMVCQGNDTFAIDAPAVDVVDTTGAGDAFCGAFAAELAEGTDLVVAARAGVAAGSLAATRAGAQPSMPRRAEIAAMVRSMTGSSERGPANSGLPQ